MRCAARLVIAFAVTASLLAAALVATALIPRAAIEPQVRASAEYLCKDEQFAEVIDGVASSKIDHYADAILLGIALQYDANAPVRSVMSSSYYHRDGRDESENLLQAATEGLPANREYLRYWHGSIALVRPLLTLLSIRDIYRLNACVMAALFVTLLMRLWRRGALVPLVGLSVAFVGVSCWFVPLSLEYTWVFLLALVQLHVVLAERFPRNAQGRALFFLVSGMLTSYLDFLTTELLTLLLPLLLMLWIDHDSGEAPLSPMVLVALAAAWGAGYVGMWALKWLLAGKLLGVNLQQAVAFHIQVRSNGVIAASAAQQRWEAFWRNVGRLFPWEYGVVGKLAGLVALLGASYAAFARRQSNINRRLLACYGVLGIVPLVRFVAISNHSYLHYFFTYRVLAATLFALVLAAGEVAWQHGSPQAPKRGTRAQKRRGRHA